MKVVQLVIIGQSGSGIPNMTLSGLSIFTGQVTYPSNISCQNRLTVGMLIGKLPLIFIVIHSQWRIQGGGWWGFKPPPHDRTDENFQHRIKNGLFSSFCYICSIVGTVAFDKYY